MSTSLVPDRETLLKALEVEWNDHIQTRQQTWQALFNVAALAVALIGIDWQLQNKFATVAFAFILSLAAFVGLQITFRHRNVVEDQKFRFILAIERELGLVAPDDGGPPDRTYVITGVTRPAKISFLDLFRIYSKHNTSLFIARMHFAILLFAVIYLRAPCTEP